MNIYSTCMSATTQSAQTQGYSRETYSCVSFTALWAMTSLAVDVILWQKLLTHINYCWLGKKKDSNDFSVCEDIFQKHSCYSMKTMNIHPFDNNHISTTFSAVKQSVWTFIGIHFSPLQTQTINWITIITGKGLWLSSPPPAPTGQEQPQHFKISTAVRLRKCQH